MIGRFMNRPDKISAKAGKPKTIWLPERLLNEVLPTGVGTGIGLSPNQLRQMIQSYYLARGWDENGFVPGTKLVELGLPMGVPMRCGPGISHI